MKEIQCTITEEIAKEYHYHGHPCLIDAAIMKATDVDELEARNIYIGQIADDRKLTIACINLSYKHHLDKMPFNSPSVFREVELPITFTIKI